jgi:hypothetical protein
VRISQFKLYFQNLTRKIFDAKKEKQIFEEARKEFGRDQGSSSKT